MLLLAGMRNEQEISTYQIWLMRRGDRELAGTVQVDETGWGTVTIRPSESVYGFDKVELVSHTLPGDPSVPDNMVLEANIPAAQPSQMVIIPITR